VQQKAQRRADQRQMQQTDAGLRGFHPERAVDEQHQTGDHGDTARQAIYPTDKLTAIKPDWLRRHFQRGSGEWVDHYRLKPNLQSRLTFRNLNLLGDYQFPDKFEVIFCRNVMIYFDRHTQEELVNRLARHLVPGGYLLIGHSESLNGLKVPFQCLKPSVYRLI
jgi:chemotaxis protein methyltransferase CheR